MTGLDSSAAIAASNSNIPSVPSLASVSTAMVPEDLLRAEAAKLCTAETILEAKGETPKERFLAAARVAAATMYLISEKLGVNFIPELPPGISNKEFHLRMNLAAAMQTNLEAQAAKQLVDRVSQVFRHGPAQQQAHGQRRHTRCALDAITALPGEPEKVIGCGVEADDQITIGPGFWSTTCRR